MEQLEKQQSVNQKLDKDLTLYIYKSTSYPSPANSSVFSILP